ncbi:MAG: hypothetical protein HYX65_06445 [Gemmatimonadetes bacterium]|nr:hypothetical protein [Gemmatimonadota bacterium]
MLRIKLLRCARAASTVLVLAISSGCATEARTIAPNSDASIARFLTLDVARSLGPNGRLLLREPGGDTLQAQQAMRIADAYIHTFGPPALGRYTSVTEREFSLEQVHPCGRAYLAETPYELELAPDPRIARLVGPHWIVQLCLDGSVPLISVSLSALASEALLAVSSGARLNPSISDIRESPIPPRFGEVPVSPEDAVAFAGRLTNGRISQLPVLIQPRFGSQKELARWRLVLEQPIELTATSSGESVAERVIYVGWERRAGPLSLLRAKPAQREVDSVTHLVDLERRRSLVQRRVGVPLEFEVVVPSRREVSP